MTWGSVYCDVRPQSGRMRRGLSSGRGCTGIIEVDEAAWNTMHGLADPSNRVQESSIDTMRKKRDVRPATWTEESFVYGFYDTFVRKHLNVDLALRTDKRVAARLERVYEVLSRYSIYLPSARDHQAQFLRRFRVFFEESRRRALLFSLRAGFDSRAVHDAWGVSPEEIVATADHWMYT